MARKAKQHAAESRAAEKRREVQEAMPPAEDVKNNVTEATIIDLVAEAMAEKKEIDRLTAERSSANGRLRGVYKKAKKAGLLNGEIQWYVNNQHRDPEDITREFAGINRIAKIMELPVGTQLGLFQDGETVAGKVDKKKADTASSYIAKLQAAEDAGYRAGRGGKAKDTNPHNLDSPPFVRWNVGWGRGQAEVLQDFGPGQPN